MDLLDRALCNDLQALHQHTILIGCDLFSFLACPGPVECATFQPFISKEKSISFPNQQFYAVSSLSTEQEGCTFIIRIKVKLEPYKSSKPVNATAQICIILEPE